MLPRMWLQLPCMNIAVNQLILHGSGPWQALSTVDARRGVVDDRLGAAARRGAQTAKLAAISATLTIGKRRGWSPSESGSIAIAYLLTSGFIQAKSPLVEVASMKSARSAREMPGLV